MAAITEQGFVLHTVAWRETSLVVELFTRDHGRIAVMAKGARRPRSALRAVLLQFQPIDVAFSGRKGELRLLTRAEWRAGLPMPSGEALLFGFYLNELLVRLLMREDPHPGLYHAYVEALAAFDVGRGSAAPACSARIAGDRRSAGSRGFRQRIGGGSAAPDSAATGDSLATQAHAGNRGAGQGPSGSLMSRPAPIRMAAAQGDRLCAGPDPRPRRAADGAGGDYRMQAGQWLAVGRRRSRREDVSGGALQDIADGRYDAPGALGRRSASRGRCSARSWKACH